MHLLLSVCVSAVMNHPHPSIPSPSHFYHLSSLKQSLFRSISNMPNLPAIDTVCSQFVHQLLFSVRSNADQQPSTGLCRISLQEPKVLHFILDLDESSIDGQFVDHKIHLSFLCLCQIVGMSQDAEASHISASTRSVLPKQSRPHQAQSGHLLFRPVKGLHQLRLPGLLQDLLSFFLASLEPLHGVDGQSGPEWLGEDDGVSWGSIIGHHKLIVFYNCDGASSHHRPLVIDCLSSAHLSTCLLCSICEPLDHQCG